MNILSCFESFAAVVECKSFSAAARLINISASKISKQITYLEEELNIKLFIRSTKQLILTEKGQRLYEKVGSLFNELKEIKEIAVEEAPLLHGTFKLCLTVSPAVLYLTSLTTQFIKNNPKIEVNLRVGSDILDICDYAFDLAISFDVINSSNMVCKKLFSVQRNIFASPDYINDYGTPNTVSELSNHNCLVNTLYGLQNKWILNKGIIHVSGNFKSNNADVLKQAALNGMGLLWVPDFSVQQEVEEGRLRKILPYETSPEIMLYAIYKKYKKNNIIIDSYLKFICEKIVGDGVVALD